MFKALFLATLFVTLVVNIIFLFAAKEKPPDLMTSTFDSIQQSEIGRVSSQKRLFLRSNDFYDYTPTSSVIRLPNEVNDNYDDLNKTHHKTIKTNKQQTYSYKDKFPSSEIRNLAKHSDPVARSTDANEVVKTNLYFVQQLKPSYSTTQRRDNLRKSDEASETSNLFNASQNNNSATAIKLQLSRKFETATRRNGIFIHDLMKKNSTNTTESLPVDYIKSTNTSPNDEDGAKNSNVINLIDSREIINNQAETSENNIKIIHPNHNINDHKEQQRDPAIQESFTLNKNPLENGRVRFFNARSLNIRVKSSRNHVFVSVDNIVIYESKSLQVKGIQDGHSSSSSSSSTSTAPLSKTIYDETSSTDGRGIHVIVLSQFDGRVMAKRIFDTYSPNQDEELCFFLNMILDGRLLIFAIKDEGSFKMPMSSLARDLLQKLGSQHIMKLRWRDMWAFVARKSSSIETNARLGESTAGNYHHHLSHRLDSAQFALTTSNSNNLAEGLTKSSRFSDWAPPVVLEVLVELKTRPERQSNAGGVSAVSQSANHHLQYEIENLNSECIWNSGNKGEDLRRLEFCSTVEGYGQVCDCNYPAPISFNPPKMDRSQLEQVPIVVMASNRPYYLYRMLRSLLSVDGINSSMIIVFIDGFYEEPLTVSRLFNLRAIQQKPLGQRSARISHHYKSSLTATFELFPRAEFAIIFEEDLDVAQDILIYFNQTVDLLRNDPSLYCVSAWNDQGYEHSTGDNGQLYRIETMPGLGWLLSRRLYKEELEPKWPSADQTHDWDMWIRTEPIRKGRECIIPDISRTFHFGSTGTNINSYFQRQYFSKHAFNSIPCNRFPDTSTLSKESYELHIEDLLREAQVVEYQPFGSTNSSSFLCSLADSNMKDYHFRHRLTNTANQTVEQKSTAVKNVIYIEMIDKHDFKNWLKLAKCWRIWDLDARGQHNSMWRLYLNGIHTFVVGVPASPYSRFKPSSLVPFNFSF